MYALLNTSKQWYMYYLFTIYTRWFWLTDNYPLWWL